MSAHVSSAAGDYPRLLCSTQSSTSAKPTGAHKGLAGGRPTSQGTNGAKYMPSTLKWLRQGKLPIGADGGTEAESKKL